MLAVIPLIFPFPLSGQKNVCFHTEVSYGQFLDTIHNREVESKSCSSDLSDTNICISILDIR